MLNMVLFVVCTVFALVTLVDSLALVLVERRGNLSFGDGCETVDRLGRMGLRFHAVCAFCTLGLVTTLFVTSF